MRLNSFAPLCPAALAVAGLSVAGLPMTGPAFAQVAPAEQLKQVDKRVTVLESQIRAVQRQVFPGGDKRFFQPEIAPAPEPAISAPGTPATPALVDLGQRVTALETQQRALTGQVEQLQYQLRQLEAAMQKLRTDAGGRLDLLEGKGAASATGAPAATALVEAPPLKPAPAASVPVPPASVPSVSAPASAPAPAPLSAAGATGADALEARYREGYSLYTGGNYPAAAKALAEFAEANPGHARASNAQYWAGRALLAQGRTADAAKAFLTGYQKFPRGERAHNSLLWLGKTLIELKQPPAACQALDQLKTAYPDRITGQFSTDLDAARTQARCLTTAGATKAGTGRP